MQNLVAISLNARDPVSGPRSRQPAPGSEVQVAQSRCRHCSTAAHRVEKMRSPPRDGSHHPERSDVCP